MLKELPGGGALRCDRVSCRGEPLGPDSRPKSWFFTKIAEITLQVGVCDKHLGGISDLAG